MYSFNTYSRIRPYHVDKTLDKFIQGPTVCDLVAQELLAYYRGEPITTSLVEVGRLSICHYGHESIPPRDDQHKITFKCSDGDLVKIVNIHTLCRQFDLIADLYELNNDVREFTLPFRREELSRAIVTTEGELEGSREPPIECLKFLRPRRTEYYLQYEMWNGGDEKFWRMVGSGLEEETRMHLSRFARIFPDKELYPIVDWVVRLEKSELLHRLLENKAPSVLLWCLCHLDDRDSRQRAIDLVKKGSFNDLVPVIRPSELCSTALDNEDSNVIIQRLCSIYEEATKTVDDPTIYRLLLLANGLRHERIGNDKMEYIGPFGVEFDTYINYTYALHAVMRLRVLDPSVTEDDERAAICTI